MLLALLSLANGQAVVTAPPKNPDARVVCHSEEVTGSLAGGRRVCHTVGEWRQQSDNAIARSTELVDQGAIHVSNGR